MPAKLLNFMEKPNLNLTMLKLIVNVWECKKAGLRGKHGLSSFANIEINAYICKRKTPVVPAE